MRPWTHIHDLHRFPVLGGSSGALCVAYSALVLAMSLPDYLFFLVNGEF